MVCAYVDYGKLCLYNSTNHLSTSLCNYEFPLTLWPCINNMHYIFTKLIVLLSFATLTFYVNLSYPVHCNWMCMTCILSVSLKCVKEFVYMITMVLHL